MQGTQGVDPAIIADQLGLQPRTVDLLPDLPSS